MSLYFHFTLGPVQGFVAQARRTRDFWAGSFVLSWLSAVAMKAVIKQGGEIVFPKADENFLQALEQGGKGPKQGNVPNRFMAKIKECFTPDKVVETVKTAWKGLAELIWQEDLERVCGEDRKHRDIWDRQINGFWEISWVLTSNIEATNLLDRRKNWRSHLPPEEPGVKCMMMDGWQEISGTSTPHAAALRAFWDELRSRGGGTMQRDLRKGEHLCAIAFIKRRFPRHFHKVKIQMSGWTLRGWRVPPQVPSVVYMAAAHWLANVITEAQDINKLIVFHDEAAKLSRVEEEFGPRDEWYSKIECISQAEEARKDRRLRYFRALDGNVFFDTALDNENIFDDKVQAQSVKQALRDIIKDSKQGSPTPFYAVLFMDGDSLGANMSKPERQPVISEALQKFTAQAGPIVSRHNGFLVYAGGDDVLALLPLEDAFPCAAALRVSYACAFDQAFNNKGVSPEHRFPATISGAIEYAHMKMPLMRVLMDAHKLLNEVAKDGRGRDAIAARVWKPGGLTIEWAMPWERALENGKVVIQQLAEDFQKTEAETPFSSKFLYKIGERFDLLNPSDGGKRILDNDQALSLMAAEYLSSGVNEKRKPKLTMQEAREKVRPLLEQCRPVTRVKCKPPQQWTPSGRLEADGVLLVRFLAQKGVEQ